MKKLFLLIAALGFAAAAYAQEPTTTEVGAEVAAALEEGAEAPAPEPKPTYWTLSLQNNINFGQTFLSQWAAGGYNNYTLAAGVDANANYAKGKMIWNNRLQMDYGFLYSADKPILQKNKDRIYLESKWGFETPIQHLSYSANFDFRTQFDNNYNYGTPTGLASEPTREDWLAARDLKSGLFSPAYINLGLGLLWTPKPWFSLNIAPLTGGVVIVNEEALRPTYTMPVVDDTADPKVYKPVRYEFGAQLKADANFVVNENLTYTTQLAMFYNYLTPKVEPRINWDNKVFWKMAKFFALTVSTNMIYDPLVVLEKGDGQKGKGIQFREFLEFGFTYTIAGKK